jgi:hypothetical protein
LQRLEFIQCLDRFSQGENEAAGSKIIGFHGEVGQQEGQRGEMEIGVLVGEGYDRFYAARYTSKLHIFYLKCLYRYAPLHLCV